MGFYFFLSYARASDGGHVKKFFDDLSQAIRDKKGLNETETVGFFDMRNIELGREWEPEIIGALQKCHTMVCLYAPAYFKSSYCGKEWEIFRLRQRLYIDGIRSQYPVGEDNGKQSDSKTDFAGDDCNEKELDVP